MNVSFINKIYLKKYLLILNKNISMMAVDRHNQILI